MNLYEQQEDNKRWTFLLVSAYVALLAFVGLGFDIFILHVHLFAPGSHAFRFPIATAAAAGFGALMAMNSYWNGPSMVLASAQAVPANPGVPEEKQLINVVAEMATASGLPMPKVYVIPEQSPNAFATGTDPSNSCIAATRGLLQMVNREELQGVIGHEMSHIRNYDVRLMTLLAALGGAIALLSDWAGRSYRYSGSGSGSSSRSSSSSDDNEGGAAVAIFFIVWIILIVLAPIISQLLALAVSRKREYLADASGAELTRNPLALASALEKISENHTPSASINHGLAHLCIADPKMSAIGDGEGFMSDLLATHPPIQSRIGILKAMASQAGA